MTATALPDAARRDIETITVIGFAHGVSHFFHLILPTLFPWLMADFGLSYTVIGVTMTVFFIVSGIGQAMAGFLVDRFGAARVLGGGILCFALAALLLHFANGYAMLIAVAVLAGLGNCVFHPADFTVLNRHVSQARLGHAFSVHGLSGNLGWAAAPLFMTSLAEAYGWRQAALGASLLALAALAVLVWRRAAIADPADYAPAEANQPRASTLDFLRSRPVWLCFLFFLFITAAFGAIQNFASPIVQALYGLNLHTAALGLSLYMIGSACGIILGGFLAQKGEHDHLIAAALGCAALLAILLASQWLPAWSILGLMAGIGFFSGIAGPSRDLLVRRAATARFGKAAFGRIYGFVYSGLDLGLALAPLIFGGLMDKGHFGSVLVGIALMQTLAILTALRVGKSAA